MNKGLLCVRQVNNDISKANKLAMPLAGSWVMRLRLPYARELRGDIPP